MPHDGEAVPSEELVVEVDNSASNGINNVQKMESPDNKVEIMP
jgi:hypothetical protein|tara:strand:+ start:303 stop:431 length:129 start_codon:yes stop_codon:yes gene_type:complete